MATITVSAHVKWSTSNLETAKKQNKAMHVSKLIKAGGYGPPKQTWGG